MPLGVATRLLRLREVGVLFAGDPHHRSQETSGVKGRRGRSECHDLRKP
jgi:hypothetical protein